MSLTKSGSLTAGRVGAQLEQKHLPQTRQWWARMSAIGLLGVKA